MPTRGTVWRPHGLLRRDALQFRRFGRICCLDPDDTLNSDCAGSPEKLISTKRHLEVSRKTVIMLEQAFIGQKCMWIIHNISTWIINYNISFPASPKTLLFRCEAQQVNKWSLFIFGIMQRKYAWLCCPFPDTFSCNHVYSKVWQENNANNALIWGLKPSCPAACLAVMADVWNNEIATRCVVCYQPARNNGRWLPWLAGFINSMTVELLSTLQQGLRPVELLCCYY